MTLNEAWAMSYDEYVQYLLKKYGGATMDYYRTPECRSRNDIARTDEGLEIHHMDEDKYILLSHPMFARQHWETQKAKRLIYADKIEHIILHIKIAAMGTGGDYACGTKFLVGTVNSLFQNPPLTGWQVGFYEKIKDNFDLYIEILHRLAHQMNGIIDVVAVLNNGDAIERNQEMLDVLFATNPNYKSDGYPSKIVNAFIEHESQPDYEFH